MNNNIIGEQISLLRSKFGMTQDDLALKIGVSKQTVSNWETGLKTPRMGAIQKLSDLFNVSKGYIIEGADDFSDEIIGVYNQLNQKNKSEVVDFAKFKLEEQNKVIQLHADQNFSTDFDLAAHLVDPTRKFTEEETDGLKSYLSKAKEDYLNKNK